jgi:hypothetical protein
MNLLPNDLETMRGVDVRTVNPGTLADIRDINIDINLPYVERALAYLKQTPNAYCLKYDDVIIKISYSQTTTSINNCMEGFYRSF